MALPRFLIGCRRNWGKITRRRAAIDKARKVLGYELKVETREDIRGVYNTLVKSRDKMQGSAMF